MKFTKITEHLDCDCINGSIEDLNNYYALKTPKPRLREQDFSSHYEKGKPLTKNDCEHACSHRGVSMSIYNDITMSKVIETYKLLFPLFPKYKPYISIIKFNNYCGNIKHTPSYSNEHHYDLYKCDTFAFQNVELVDVKELHNV